jgi:uncharacterized Tic20 family protein/DNA-directed RNA polymerase subunit RPC12/RpoP
MIHLRCPRCGKEMELPEDRAGGSALCPNCGNVNMVPPVLPPVGAAGTQPPPAGPRPLSEKDARMWAMLCHLGGLAGYVVPFGNIIAPLVIWLTQKDKSWFVDRHGKEALNFQISWTIWAFIAAVLVLVIVGICLAVAISIAKLILIILAAVAANDGKFYQYPLTIRFLK